MKQELWKQLYEMAKKYRKLSWSIIPLYNYSKNPSPLNWKPYQDRRATDEEFEQWFNNRLLTGIGLITGKISGIVVLDEDLYKEGGIRVSIKTGMLAKTGRGGNHHYFRYVEPIKSSGFRQGINVEIKSDGSFVVLPLSQVKNDGVIGTYEWIEKCMPEDLLEVTEKQLAPYRGENEVAINLAELASAPEGTRHNNLRSMALSSFARFRPQEWGLAENIVRYLASQFTPPHPINDVERIIKDTQQFIQTHNTRAIQKEIESEPVLPNDINDLANERIEDKKLEAMAPKTGWPELDVLIKGFIPGHIYTLTGTTNVGKCMGKNTPILMFDGSIKMSQDIIVGDVLMGPGNMPKKVLSINSGKGDMFLIKQDWGIDYVVNKNHVLSLKFSTLRRKKKTWKEYVPGGIINIPVIDYLGRSKTFRKFARGWHTMVNFSKQKILIDPYFLGVWLGDGTTESTTVTVDDREIINELQKYATKIGVKMKLRRKTGCWSVSLSQGKQQMYIPHNGKQYNREQYARLMGKCPKTITNWINAKKIEPHRRLNFLYSSFRKYGLLGNKHIPDCYRINSRNIRLELLAGLIDTDGWVSKNRSKNTGRGCFSYMISITNQKLAEDILLLVRSLGFNSRITNKISKMKRKDGSIYQVLCYTVSIQGELKQIPVRVSRKKITSIRKKEVGCSTIKIIPQGVGKYYGFTLDGDGLYLLSDCTVTHNSSLCCNFAEALRRQGKKTLYIALEPDIVIIDYLASVRLRKPFSELNDNDLFVAKDDKFIKIYLHREIKEVDDLVKAVGRLTSRERYDLIIIDHIGYFVKTEKDWIQQQSNVIKELAFLAKNNKSAIMMVAHLRKPGKNSKDVMPTQDDISGSSAFKQDSTDVLVAYRPTKEINYGVEFEDVGVLLVTKTKSGPNGGVELQFTQRSAKIWSKEELASDELGKKQIEQEKEKKLSLQMLQTHAWEQKEKDPEDEMEGWDEPKDDEDEEKKEVEI